MIRRIRLAAFAQICVLVAIFWPEMIEQVIDDHDAAESARELKRIIEQGQ